MRNTAKLNPNRITPNTTGRLRHPDGVRTSAPTVRWALVLAVVVCTTAACAGSSGTEDELTGPRPERARYKNLNRSGRQVQEFDLNRDTTPDQWSVLESGRLL
ncbi:MAG: hypothetical protein AAFX99_29805, partial [Myxococcota bacterium]